MKAFIIKLLCTNVALPLYTNLTFPKLAAFVLSLTLMLFFLQNRREEIEQLKSLVHQLEEALEVLACTFVDVFVHAFGI